MILSFVDWLLPEFRREIFVFNSSTNLFTSSTKSFSADNSTNPVTTSSIPSSSLCLNDQNTSMMIMHLNNNDDDGELNHLLNETISSDTQGTVSKSYPSSIKISSLSSQQK